MDFCTHCGQPTRPENGGNSAKQLEQQPDAQFCPEYGAPARLPITRFLADEPEYMGFWTRATAVLIDMVVMVLINVIIITMEISSVPLPTDPPMDLLITEPIAELIAPIIFLVYYVVLTGLRGQTFGKMALGIMVVNEQGKPPGILRAAFREILGKFVSYIVLCLGFLWIGWDKKKQGWHDHIASTYVISGKPGKSSGKPKKQRDTAIHRPPTA